MFSTRITVEKFINFYIHQTQVEGETLVLFIMIMI